MVSRESQFSFLFFDDPPLLDTEEKRNIWISGAVSFIQRALKLPRINTDLFADQTFGMDLKSEAQAAQPQTHLR